MTKIYRLSVDDCENKCAYDIDAMSNEEKAQLINRHKDVAEEFTMDGFFLALNCSDIDMETSYWFFIDE
jgi:hypothetical protein